MEKIAAIILAAGASSRLGSPKQLLLYKGKNLIERSIEVLLDSGLSKIVVVVGANKDQVTPFISNYPVQIIENTSWELGMGGSVKQGIKAMKQFPDISACLITVCDQPYISADLIKEIIRKYTETNAKIVASFYGETIGVPVLFDRHFFPELKALNDGQGAKSIFYKHHESIEKVDFPDGLIDVDTVEDYKNLK